MALCALWCSSEQQSALDLRVPEDYCDKNSFLPTDKYQEGMSLTAEGSHKVSKLGVKSDPPPPAGMKLTHPARLIWFGFPHLHLDSVLITPLLPLPELIHVILGKTQRK